LHALGNGDLIVGGILSTIAGGAATVIARWDGFQVKDYKSSAVIAAVSCLLTSPNATHPDTKSRTRIHTHARTMKVPTMRSAPHSRTLVVSLLASALVLVALPGFTGCASKPEITQSGFLDDYSKLSVEDESRMVYASPDLAQYDAFMIDPIQLRVGPTKLSPDDRAEAARYFLVSAANGLRSQGIKVTSEPGVGVARLQMALTDIATSTWWRKIDPLWRAMGDGTGGAAMEAQILDSITGQQLAAVVQAESGNQFDFTAFSTLADVKSVMDKWAEIGAKELQTLRARKISQ
jgi:hypothetical protein